MYPVEIRRGVDWSVLVFVVGLGGRMKVVEAGRQLKRGLKVNPGSEEWTLSYPQDDLRLRLVCSLGLWMLRPQNQMLRGEGRATKGLRRWLDVYTQRRPVRRLSAVSAEQQQLGTGPVVGFEVAVAAVAG